jgi:hypothetical protein
MGMSRIGGEPSADFPITPGMKELFAEAMKLREVDRQKARRQPHGRRSTRS